MLGTIAASLDGSGVQLVLDGEVATTQKYYKYLESYHPTVGDRVLVEEISGTYVVLGKVTDSASSSEIIATKVKSTYNSTDATIQLGKYSGMFYIKATGDYYWYRLTLS